MNEAVTSESRIAETKRPADPTAQPVNTPAVLPRLVVLRGLRIGVEYPIYPGTNIVGRFADRPVDIDLLSQEPIEMIWSSRRHAAVTFEQDVVAIEDLNSLNGTWVNGARVPPGQKRVLRTGDIVQIGTVQMKFVFT